MSTDDSPHKWSDKWGIPGGKIKWGETNEAGVAPRNFGETGLKISGIKFRARAGLIHSRNFIATRILSD